MRPVEEPPPLAPPGAVVYAIGDIHGRRDLLDGAIDALSAATGSDKPVIAVFLGDYIDRGPDARGVIDRLMEFRDSGVCETLFLRGNHEQVVLDILDGEDESLRWLEYGGLDTLAAYGAPQSPPHDLRGPGRLRALAERLIPPAHVDFMRATQLTAKLGDYLFVHAGLRPDRLVEEQSPADLLWFRYYDDETPVHAETVVHGHSVNPAPVLGRHRIGIDTEAYASGILTLLRLEADQRTFLKVVISDASPTPRVGTWDTTDSAYRAAPRKTPRTAARTAAAAKPGAGRRLLLPAAVLVGMLVLAAATLGLTRLRAGEAGNSHSGLAPAVESQLREPGPEAEPPRRG